MKRSKFPSICSGSRGQSPALALEVISIELSIRFMIDRG